MRLAGGGMGPRYEVLPLGPRILSLHVPGRLLRLATASMPSGNPLASAGIL